MPCHSEETVAHQHGPAELFGPQGIWNGLHQIGWSQAGCRRVQGQSGWPTGFTIPLLSNHFKRQTWANESNPHQLHGVISPDTRLFSIGSELGSLVGSQSERDEAYRFSCHEATVFLKNLPPLAVDTHDLYWRGRLSHEKPEMGQNVKIVLQPKSHGRIWMYLIYLIKHDENIWKPYQPSQFCPEFWGVGLGSLIILSPITKCSPNTKN